MSLLRKLFGRKRGDSNVLVGCWHLITDAQSAIEGDVIVSNQPSVPAEERSRFSLAPDGILTLELGGVQSRFRRGEKRAPRV